MIKRTTLPLILGALLAAACGGTIVTGGTTGTASAASSGSGGAGSGTSGTTGAGGAPEVQCTANPPIFPGFDKTCADASECAIAYHQINCCGSRTAIGINKAAIADFGMAEATCESQYPGCGCDQGATSAEDGKSVVNETAIQVACAMGACTTFVP